MSSNARAEERRALRYAWKQARKLLRAEGHSRRWIRRRMSGRG